MWYGVPPTDRAVRRGQPPPMGSASSFGKTTLPDIVLGRRYRVRVAEGAKPAECVIVGAERNGPRWTPWSLIYLRFPGNEAVFHQPDGWDRWTAGDLGSPTYDCPTHGRHEARPATSQREYHRNRPPDCRVIYAGALTECIVQ